MVSEPGDGIEFVGSLEQLPVSEESQPDEITWVEAARDGDRAAFARLYDRYSRMVHGILLTKVPPSDVDDLVQDTFMIALRRLPSLREPASFGAWLAAIARNRAHDFYRHAAPEDQLADDASEQIVSPESNSGEQEAAEILEILRSLPDTYREALILRLVEGMTGPEIAARTGLTHGSVRVTLHRGMEMLRAKLQERERREDQL